jgi:ectoine hydroxylase-related dioxygenase (phytanoyl-CoA dioxygenase family)
MLTEQQLEHYYREGYVCVPGLVSQETVEAVLQEAPAGLGDGKRWQDKTFQHESPDDDAKLHRLLVEPSVVEAATVIFGRPPRVFYAMLAVVPPQGGHGLPWHQDNQYTHVLGGALNIFIALCTITPNKGNLWVAPKSHLLGRQPFEENVTTAPGFREATQEPENALLLPTLHSGDACIFDRYLMHCSRVNETDEPRYAYAAQLQAENARLADTGQREPIRMLASDLRQRWLEKGLLT